MSLFTVCGRSSLASASPRPPLSPYLKPLPAPPVDAELLDLQAQVRPFCDRSAWLQSLQHTTASCDRTCETMLASWMQLSAACTRVAALRATVPGQLTQRLTEHLQQCRPTGEISQHQQLSSPPSPSHEEMRPAVMDAEGQHEADITAGPPGQTNTDPGSQTGHQGDAISKTPLSPAPADLQDMYAAAVQRMPALR